MADFKLTNASAKEAWSTKYFKEYVAQSGLVKFMSSADNAIIRVNMDLKSAGDLVHLPYFASLKGTGVSGGATLEGNEEALLNYSTAIKVKHVRNAVMIPENESFRTELDVANVARGSLKDWSAEKLRDALLEAQQTVVVAGGNDSDGTPVEDTYVPYATASAGQRNSYLTANSDRILFGTTAGVAGNFANSLAGIASGQTLSADMISKAKDMAETTAAFRITPHGVKDTDIKTFVLTVGVEGFRALQNDPKISAANRDARPREVEANPLFTGGDLYWDGIIIKKIAETSVVGNVGAASAPVRFAALMGANALGVAFSRKPSFRMEEKDFQHKIGVGITEIRGQSKMSAAGVQTGMVGIYFAAA